MCCLVEWIVKYVLFFANLVFMLSGLSLIGIGIALLVQVADIVEIVPPVLNAIPISLIVLGVLVAGISFFGCCGAIRESRCLLTMYSICMAILAGGKLYLTIVIFQGLKEIQTTVEEWVNQAFAAQTPNDGPFDLLQIAFQCCGTTGQNSYENELPLSCCPLTNPPATSCLAANAFDQGCTTRLGSYFESFGEAIGIVLIMIILIEVLAMSFGFLLCSSVSKKRRLAV